MKRTRDINDSDLYDALDDSEVHEYNVACIMYSCGLDGSSVGNLDVDALMAAINDCYWHKNSENTNPEAPLLTSAAGLFLGATRTVLLSRLRLSYLRMSVAKGILENE